MTSSNIINGKRKESSPVRSTPYENILTDNDDDSDDLSNFGDGEDDPPLELQHNHRKPDAALVPILRHVLKNHYTKNEETAIHTSKKWEEEDKEIQAMLSTLSDSYHTPTPSSLVTFDSLNIEVLQWQWHITLTLKMSQIGDSLSCHHLLFTEIQMV